MNFDTYMPLCNPTSYQNVKPDLSPESFFIPRYSLPALCVPEATTLLIFFNHALIWTVLGLITIEII